MKIDADLFYSIILVAFIIGLSTAVVLNNTFNELVKKEVLDEACKLKFGKEYFYVDNEFGVDTNLSCGVTNPKINDLKKEVEKSNINIKILEELDCSKELNPTIFTFPSSNEERKVIVTHISVCRGQ